MHIKGSRFGFKLARRFGVLKHHDTYTVKWNKHTGAEIHYVLKGDIAWELQKGNKTISISGGSFGIIPAGANHRAINNKGTPAIRLGVIFEKPSASLSIGTPFTHDDLKRIFHRFQEHGGRVRRFSSKLSALVHEFSSAMTFEATKDPDGQLRLRSLASSLLYETYAALGEPEALAEGHEVIPTICKWIDKHCADDIKTNQLVKLSGYGRSRFFSLFFADTGMTPNDYLIRARINLSKRKLSGKDLPDSYQEIGLSCGFKSASVFSTTFHKHVGLSPREFRKRAMAETQPK